MNTESEHPVRIDEFLNVSYGGLTLGRGQCLVEGGCGKRLFGVELGLPPNSG